MRFAALAFLLTACSSVDPAPQGGGGFGGASGTGGHSTTIATGAPVCTPRDPNVHLVCGDALCVADWQCEDDEWCGASCWDDVSGCMRGRCAPPLPDLEPCERARQCDTGCCADGVCNEPATCADGGA